MQFQFSQVADPHAEGSLDIYFEVQAARPVATHSMFS